METKKTNQELRTKLNWCLAYVCHPRYVQGIPMRDANYFLDAAKHIFKILFSVVSINPKGPNLVYEWDQLDAKRIQTYRSVSEHLQTKAHILQLRSYNQVQVVFRGTTVQLQSTTFQDRKSVV